MKSCKKKNTDIKCLKHEKSSFVSDTNAVAWVDSKMHNLEEDLKKIV